MHVPSSYLVARAIKEERCIMPYAPQAEYFPYTIRSRQAILLWNLERAFVMIDSSLSLLKQVSACYHRNPINSSYVGSGSYRWNNNKAAHVCCHQESFSPVSFSTKPSTACLMNSSMLASLPPLIFFHQKNILATERGSTHLCKVS